MPSTVPFWIAFGATVLLLVASLYTGFWHRRKLHLWLGPLTIVAMAIAIWETEKLMGQYSFPEDELAFHLIFAKAGGLLALPVILTGLWLWRNPRVRVWHRTAVIVWLVAVLMATGTGLWMFGLGVVKAG